MKMDWRQLFASLRQRPNLPGLLLSTVALGLAFSFVSPFLSMWGTTEVGLSPFQFGLFMTVVASCSMVLSTVLARLSDTRLSRRTVLLLGSASGALGFTGYALLRDPLLLLLVGGTCVAVASVCFSQLFAHVRETFGHARVPRAEAGFIMSIVRIGFSVAWTFGPAVGAVMMTQLGFVGLFLTAATLYLVFHLGVWRFVPTHQRPRPLVRPNTPSVWRVLTRRDLLLSFLAFVLVFAATAMNALTLPLLVTQVLGGSGRDLGITFGIGPLVEIPLMLWFGQLAARGHQERLLYLGAAITAVYYFGLSFVQAPWQVFPLQVLSGASFAILTNVAILYFQDLVPGQTGLATNMFSNASNLGNLGGFFAFGALLQHTGHRGVVLVCALLAASMLGLLFTSHTLRDRLAKSEPS